MAIQWSEKTVIDVTKLLYDAFCLRWGVPKEPLRQLMVGNINYDRPEDRARWGECVQCQGRSNIYYDLSLLSEDDDTIIMVIAHELAHVWVGCEKQHNQLFQSFLRKFKKYAKMLLTE